jgi:serine/threonine-protein phosphatase Stp1
MTGFYGKLPSYGDFVRRALPQSFVQPWDHWLQTCVAATRDSLGPGFDDLWAAAPPWRFRLEAGVCGASPVAGVLLMSHDLVGRQFPMTLAAVLPDNAAAPPAAWYAGLEQAALALRDRGEVLETVLADLPGPQAPELQGEGPAGMAPGWDSGNGRRLNALALPTPPQFLALLRGAARLGKLFAAGVSHRGTVRTRNEDAFVDRSDIGVWAVADGAGGHGSGDVASAAAAAAIADLPVGLSAAEVLAQVRLRLDAVHADLQRRCAASGTGEIMATTIVVLMARGEHFACLWAGDSRAYLLRDGDLCQITHDHSLVQEMVEAGALAPEDAENHPQANIITRALGSPEALQLDKVSGRVLPGDVMLLCTDGLFKALPLGEIARVMAAGAGPQTLLDQALKAGARDNVTAVIIQA